MQYKQLILASVFLLIVTLGISHPTNASPQTLFNFDESLGLCHQKSLVGFSESTISFPQESPNFPSDSVTLFGEGVPIIPKNGKLGLRYCFSFSATQDVHRGNGNGTLNVIEFAEIWQQAPAGLVLQRLQANRLPCTVVGDVLWNDASKFISFTGNGYIQCKTIDLHATTLELTNGYHNLCSQGSACTLPINEVVNYVNIVPSTLAGGSLDGPIFKYESVLLNLHRKSGDVDVEFGINADTMTVSVSESDVQDDFFLAIEQEIGTPMFKFHLNNVSAPYAKQVASQPYTLFSSQPSTIYFGYNPDTATYLNGSFYNGIFDPMCCGNGGY